MISIVTPSFKQLPWLRLAIASVADQTGFEIEHIVHDAGSPHIEEFFNNELVRHAHSKYHPELFVEKDEGMYDAVNRGLAKAKGDICAYLNCDEQYLPGALARVTEFFGDHPTIDVVFSDVVLVNERGDPISYRRSILPRVRHIRASHLNTLSCGTFFRRRLVEAGFVFDPRWKDVGDAVWVENLLGHNVRMGTIAEPLAIFTFTGQNRSANTVAKAERAQRTGRTILGANPLFNKAVVAEHRIRKALAGAYKRRDIGVSIYTQESPNRRQHRTASQVGYCWPT